MMEYRHAREAERSTYLPFADMVFSEPDDPMDFASLLPKVYGADRPTAHLQRIAIDEDLGIRGLVAMLPGQMHVQNTVLHTGFIGTVSVHPEARGEGHMKQLMHMVIDEMKESGVDIAFLSGQRQRYEYFGFVPGGVCCSFRINRNNIRHALSGVDASELRFSPLHAGSPAEQACIAFQQTLPCWFDRSDPNFTTVCRSFKGQPFVITQKESVVGWIICNEKGTVISEIVTQPPAQMDAVLKAWLNHRAIDEITLRLPESQWAHVTHLRTWAEETWLSHSVNTRIFHYAKVVKTLLKLKTSYQVLQDGRLSLSCEGEAFTITVKDNQVTVEAGAEDPIVLDELSANRLLTAPFPYDGKPQAPLGWFPLPIYVGQADEF